MNYLYNQLCDLTNLRLAWTQFRSEGGAPGADWLAIARYESNLEENLDDLVSRLSAGRYFPLPAYQIGGMGLVSGGEAIAERLIEDCVTQRAALNAIAPLFGSGAEHRNYNASCGERMAVARVLHYRAGGDIFAASAEIGGFSPVCQEKLLRLLEARINDRHLMELIRLWLGGGALSLQAAPGHPPHRVPGLIDEEALEEEIGDGSRPEAIRRLFGRTIKQFGHDAALIALGSAMGAFASEDRPRRLLTPKTLALAGATALATAAWPAAARLLREGFAAPRSAGASRIGPLAPWLSDLAFHDLDLAMTNAGSHFVRHARSFMITTRSWQTAQGALELVAREMSGMRLQPEPQTMRIKRFDQGVEFLGYRFHERLIAAEPLTRYEHPLPGELWSQTASGIRNGTARLAERAKERLGAGLNRAKAFIHRP
jgi:hypothetical protein